MERSKIKSFLTKHYSEPMVNAVLRSVRRPSLPVIVSAEKELGIPAEAWLDIRSYLNKHDAGRGDKQSTPPAQENGENRTSRAEA